MSGWSTSDNPRNPNYDTEYGMRDGRPGRTDAYGQPIDNYRQSSDNFGDYGQRQDGYNRRQDGYAQPTAPDFYSYKWSSIVLHVTVRRKLANYLQLTLRQTQTKLPNKFYICCTGKLD